MAKDGDDSSKDPEQDPDRYSLKNLVPEGNIFTFGKPFWGEDPEQGSSAPEGETDLTGMKIGPIIIPDVMGPDRERFDYVGDFGLTKDPKGPGEKPADDSEKQPLGTLFFPNEEPGKQSQFPIKIGPPESMYDILNPATKVSEGDLQKRFRTEAELHPSFIPYPTELELREDLSLFERCLEAAEAIPMSTPPVRYFEPSGSKLGLLEHAIKHYLKANNRKHGEREVDLAVKGWRRSTNTLNPSASVKFARENTFKGRDLETHVESTAYIGNVTAKPVSGWTAVYIRGEGVKQRLPAEVVEEARSYHRKLNKSKQKALRFLLGVYKQVVVQERDKEKRLDDAYKRTNEFVRDFKLKDARDVVEEAKTISSKRAKGNYAQRFQARQGAIAGVLHYFADKLRGFGRTTEAERLDKVVDKHIAKPIEYGLFNEPEAVKDILPGYFAAAPS